MPEKLPAYSGLDNAWNNHRHKLYVYLILLRA